MSLTRVTDNVVTVGTIAPGKLSTGHPEWDSSGVLSAVGFVGDASELSVVGVSAAEETILSALTSTVIDGYINAKGFIGYGGFLTNVELQTQVVVITANSYTIQPTDNFCTLVFTNSAQVFTLNPFAYDNGHRTAVVQYNTQPVQFESEDIVNIDEFSRTKGLYSKAYMQFTFPYWTIYGDLTSLPPSAAPVVPPAPVGTTSFDKIAAGDSVSYIMSGSRLYSAGSGGVGRLGLNDLNSRSLFTLVSGNWANVSAKYRHTGALSGLSANNYDLFMVGDNAYGQLGTNNTNNRSTFTRITAPVNGKWSSVAPGFNNTYALSSTALYGVGYNNEGQLGLNNSSYSYPYYVTDYQNRSTFTQVPGSWSSFSADSNHVYALAGGVIYYAGYTPFGSSVSFTATPNPDGNWVKVTSGQGQDVVVALSVNNRLYYAGGGTFGNPAPTTWTQIPGSYTDLCPFGAESGQTFWSVIALSATGGRIARLGYSSFTEILPGTWTGVQFLNSQLIKLGSSFYVIGDNYMDKFGLNIGYSGSFSSRSTFTLVPGSWSRLWVGDSSSYAVDGSNNLYFSGSQYYFSAPGGPTFFRSTFTQIPAGYQPAGTIVDVKTDGFYDAEFLLMNTGTIFARGGFAYGHAGIPNAPGLQAVDTFTALPGTWSTGAVIKTSGNGNTSYILNGSTLYSTGDNSSGQLALGLNPITTGPFTAYVTNDRSTFTQIPGNWSAVSGGVNHVVALSSNGRLFGAGTNASGQLGLGNLSILRTSTFTVIGSGNWTAIETGTSTTYALSGNRLFACGVNSDGQLGINTTTPRSTLTLLSGNWNSIAINSTTLYALSGTKLFACGANSTGQLGLGNTTPRSTLTQISGDWGFIADGFSHAIGLSSYDTGKFTPFSVGSNSFGELSLNDRVTRTTFTTITAG